MVTHGASRTGRLLRDHRLSQRRACGLLYAPRSTLGYRLRQPGKDAAMLFAMNRLSGQYPRYGYRRIRIFLRREGFPMGIKSRASTKAPGGPRIAAQTTTPPPYCESTAPTATASCKSRLGI